MREVNTILKFLKNKIVITLVAVFSLMFATATVAFAADAPKIDYPTVPANLSGMNYVELYEVPNNFSFVALKSGCVKYTFVKDGIQRQEYMCPKGDLYKYDVNKQTWNLSGSVDIEQKIGGCDGYKEVGTAITNYNSLEDYLKAYDNLKKNVSSGTGTGTGSGHSSFGIPIDASTFQGLVQGIKDIVVVVLPVGMGIMGIMLCIELVPGLIKKFF